MGRQYKIRKQLIDSMLQNFDWETNPNWQIELTAIDMKIKQFWNEELKRKFNRIYND